MCKISILSFLPHLRNALAPFEAKVEWAIVQPKPRYILHWSWNPNAFKIMNHSVFLIATKEGREYVADFTMEQFGYFNNWLMDKNEFFNQRTMTGAYRIAGQLDQDGSGLACDLVYHIGRTADRLRDAYD